MRIKISSIKISSRLFASALLAALLANHPALALEPAAVAVLVNANSPASVKVAAHYAAARQIPADQIISLPMPILETISPEDYQHQVAEPLRKALRDKGLEKKIICIATTYDVPLRIENEAMTAGEQKELEVRRKDLADTMGQLRDIQKQLDGFLPAPTSRPAATTAPRRADPPPGMTGPPAQAAPEDTGATGAVNELAKKIEPSLRGAMNRFNHASAVDKARFGPAFLEMENKLIGTVGIIRTMQVTNETPDADKIEAQRHTLALEVEAAQKRINELSLNADDPAHREEILTLRHKYFGLLGTAQTLENILPLIQHQESHAALDSELMLLWIEHYAHARWLPNPKCLTVWPYLPAEDKAKRIMMVGRLDGSSVEKTLAMIDTGLAVEKKGLDGVMYIDARGLHGVDAYSQYDAELRMTANYVRDNTDVHVVLDDAPELLLAANCPNAAFYCGWYSLQHYVDSCQWLPGCVGYHVASAELMSLHRPGETGWVVNLLDRGVCGTLGPVREPYLLSFPKPELFFPLVLSGKYTMGEVYLMTEPVVSWCTAYVGDPLYTPCKARPRLGEEKLKEHPLLRNAGAVLEGG